MTVLKFDPVRSFEAVARKMGDVAGEFEKGFSFEYGSFAPRVDIAEDEKGIYFQFELSGINKEDVKLKINDEDVLFISGVKKRRENTENMCCLRSERNFGEFSRSFQLPENINRDSISAKYENGVLFVSIDKKEPEKPKEVEISIS